MLRTKTPTARLRRYHKILRNPSIYSRPNNRSILCQKDTSQHKQTHKKQGPFHSGGFICRAFIRISFASIQTKEVRIDKDLITDSYREKDFPKFSGKQKYQTKRCRPDKIVRHIGQIYFQHTRIGKEHQKTSYHG